MSSCMKIKLANAFGIYIPRLAAKEYSEASKVSKEKTNVELCPGSD